MLGTVYEVIYSPQAIEDYDEIISHIFYDFADQFAAEHFMDEIEKLEDILSVSAESFAFCDDIEFRLRKIRIIHTKEMHYKLLYKVENRTVNVLAIFHSSQDYQQIFHTRLSTKNP